MQETDLLLSQTHSQQLVYQQRAFPEQGPLPQAWVRVREVGELLREQEALLLQVSLQH